MSNFVFNWFDNHANPILLKDIYQGLRSKNFTIWYGLALLGSVITYMFIPFIEDNDSIGKVVFGIMYFVIYTFSTIITPAGTGRQLREEIQTRTFDLIAITHLRPMEVLVGRFQAALFKVILLISYLGPFIVAAFLFGAIDSLQIIVTMILMLLTSSLSICVILMLNAITANLKNSRFLTFIVQPLLLLQIGSLGIAQFIFILTIPKIFAKALFPHQAFLLFAWLCISVFLLCWFFLSIGAEQLTPIGIRDSRRPKKVLLLLVVINSLIHLVIPFTGTLKTGNNLIIAINFVLSSIIMFFCIGWAGQPSHTPKRLQIELEKKGTLKTIFSYILSDGYWPTLLYCLLSFVVIFPSKIPSSSAYKVILALWAFQFAYFIYYTGVSCFLRSLLSEQKQTVKYYFIMLLVTVFSTSLIGSILGESLLYSKSNLIFTVFPHLDFIERFTSASSKGSYTDQSELLLGLILPLSVGLICAAFSRKSKITS
ncbi:MAG: hypothetical protein ACI86H_001409 [bacterium]|jgi:hypothetical protein